MNFLNPQALSSALAALVRYSFRPSGFLKFIDSVVYAYNHNLCPCYNYYVAICTYYVVISRYKDAIIVITRDKGGADGECNNNDII